MVSETGEYKGRPTLTLKKTPNEKWSMTFGLAKAKLILQHVKDIDAFVEEFK